MELALEPGELVLDYEDYSDTLGVAEPISSDHSEAYHGDAEPVDSAMDDFINEVTPSSSKEARILQASEDDLLEALALEVQEKKGPPIHSSVAKLINNHLSRDFRRFTSGGVVTGADDQVSHGALVVEKMKKLTFPDNLSELTTCKINAGVYKALPNSARKNCNDMQVIESSMCKSITAQGLALEKLVDVRHKFPEAGDQINEIFKLMNDSLEFNCFARARTNDARRDQVLASVNSNYRHLSISTKPSDGLLFGSDLEGAMKAVESANRLSQKLVTPTNKPVGGSSRSFLGQRGRGRGRMRPYPRPQGIPRFQDQWSYPNSSSSQRRKPQTRLVR